MQVVTWKQTALSLLPPYYSIAVAEQMTKKQKDLEEDQSKMPQP